MKLHFPGFDSPALVLAIGLMVGLISAAHAANTASAVPSGAVACASEGGTCLLPDGATASVYFGAGSKYFYQPGAAGSVSCSTATFGDPDPGVAKACYALVTQLSAGAVPCAAANGSCSVPTGSTATVFYGAGTSYNYKLGESGSVSCNNATFTDPDPGVVKACFLASEPTTTSFSVYVAYAENERAPTYFPDPWLGSPKTTFLGYPGPAWDTGGILILNTGTTSITLSQGARVDGFADGSAYQLWDGMIPSTGLVIPPGNQVILAQTGALPSTITSPPYSAAPCVRSASALCWSNFDSSDTPLNQPRNTATPLIHLTINGATQTFVDSAQVLNTGGFDYGNDYSLNESVQWRLVGGAGPSLPAGTGVPAVVTPVNVTTYHDDAQRTGLDNQESILTPAHVASGAFTKLNTVTFNGHPDAQPLVVSAQTWASWGLGATYPHDVVYVATESNDLFAIDGSTGAILAQRNFGTPVAQADLPGGCGNNPATVGINSTPVIDATNRVMYLISYGIESGALVHRVHKINLVDLSDNVASVIVAASGKLSDGTKVNFESAYQRQRPGLLLSNGTLYAGFGSFCDLASNYSRGWILGWNASTLAALPSVALMNRETTAQIGGGLNSPAIGLIDFLASIWQSGYGIAADSAGNVYAQTGNSNGLRANNYPDSVVKVSSNLATVSDYFTPSNFLYLDQQDLDLGSAGVMVIPDQPSGLKLAASPSKDGRLFLLNRNNMGKFVANGPDVPPSVSGGPCWCGPDYLVGSDGLARVVSTGGTGVQSWLVPTASGANLSLDATGVPLPAGNGDSGFMSSTSSYGTLANSGVIWSVSRPVNGRLFLQALDATSGAGGGSPSLNGSNNAVTDQSGNVWSFGAATRNPGEHSILLNGVATSGIGVKLVIGNDGNAYHLNGYGQWYTGDGTNWTLLAAPPNARMPSQAASVITPALGGSLTDAAGRVWSFGPVTRLAGERNLIVNGVPSNGGFALMIVIGSDGVAYHYNAYGQWYTGDGSTWTSVAGAPSTPVPSATGATIITPATGGSLKDAAGNVWSFGTGLRFAGEASLLINGSAAAGGFAAMLVLGADGNIYQYNAYGQWYAGSGTTANPWTQVNGTPSNFVPSRTGATVYPAFGGSLTDAKGNVWTFGAAVGNGNNYIVLNGVTTSGSGTSMVVGAKGTVYTVNSSGQWYSCAATGYTLQSQAPVTFAPVIGSYVTPATPGVLRELQLVDTGAWASGGNSNVVPVVANGHVYVGSTNALTIWGIE